MGLIKAVKGALGGMLADSWKEAIHVERMDNTVILRSGTKINDKRSGNKKGSDNIISNGSVILVEENTCMLTIDNGKITNVVTEPGEYIFDSSTSPSIFAGQINESVMDAIERFTFGGSVSREQRAVYINMQPLPGIPFGTGTPMPYPDPRYNTTIDLRFYGTFEIKIEDAEMAVRFYKEVAGKGTGSGDLIVGDIFKTQQYKNEFMQAMMQALNMLSAQGISYNQISTHLFDLTENVRKATENNWKQRGFTVQNVGMGPVTISDESKELLKDRLKADTMLGGDVQKAMMTGSLARGIENAGSNKGGAMTGFMGVNMAANTGANILGQFGNDSSWTCSCGAVNNGKFCVNCGKNKDGISKNNSWICSECGSKNNGKFCADCGAVKPKKKSYKCDKCGFIPENPENPPKFCPECGDVFSDEDLTD